MKSTKFNSMCWKCNGFREIKEITITPTDEVTGVCTIDTGFGSCTCGGFWQPVGGN